MKTSRAALVLLFAAACAGPGSRAADVQDPAGPSPAALQQALFACNELVEPSRGRRVTYDTGRKLVGIAFTTPPEHVVDFATFWDRWRMNQWRVLTRMEQSQVPVEWVVVETNHTDGSGRVRVTSPASVVREHARTNSDAWRAGSRVEQLAAGTTVWTLVEP